jgi:hypothetical protein
LYTIAEKGHIEVVQELLNQGASVDIKKESGCAHLRKLAEVGNLEVITRVDEKKKEIRLDAFHHTS